MYKLDINWEAQDWSKSNNAIAKELRCSPITVLNWRKKLGKPKFRRSPDISEMVEPFKLAEGSRQQIIKKLNLSTYRFYQLSRMLGRDPHLNSSLARARLDPILNELLFTDRRIWDIAISYGWHSESAFIHYFTRYIGVSPTEYRRKRAS